MKDKKILELNENLHILQFINSYKIMWDLLDLYENEHDTNQGELTPEFIEKVFNHLIFLENLILYKNERK